MVELVCVLCAFFYLHLKTMVNETSEKKSKVLSLYNGISISSGINRYGQKTTIQSNWIKIANRWMKVMAC